MVFLDFFGVALVVPLLTSYFRDAGINTKLLGLMSSLYSISQILGGIVIGILSDTQSKHDVLMLSLLGSAVSYFIVGSSKSVAMLFLSRVLVGLVKQTYTIATTVVNEITDKRPELRSQELGRLSAISTVSFIIGPSVGSILYSSISKDAPAKAAALCFVLNAAICIIFIPRTGIMAAVSRQIPSDAVEDIGKKSSSFNRFLSAPYKIFIKQLSDLAKIQNVLPVILMRLAIIFVESSMSSRNIVNYYENRFGIPTSALGFMQTATSGKLVCSVSHTDDSLIQLLPKFHTCVLTLSETFSIIHFSYRYGDTNAAAESAIKAFRWKYSYDSLCPKCNGDLQLPRGNCSFVLILRCFLASADCRSLLSSHCIDEKSFL